MTLPLSDPRSEKVREEVRSTQSALNRRVHKLRWVIAAVLFLFCWPMLGIAAFLCSPLLLTLALGRLFYAFGEATSWKFLRIVKLAKFVFLYLFEQVLLIPTFVSLFWYNKVTARGDKSVRFDVPFAEFGKEALGLANPLGSSSSGAQSDNNSFGSNNSTSSIKSDGGGGGAGVGGSEVQHHTTAATATSGSFSSFKRGGLSKTSNKFIADCRVDVLMHPDCDISKLRPVIVFVYGGVWASGSKTYYTKTCDIIRRSCDAVVVCPDYPKWPQVTIPAMTDTIFHVLRWIHRNIRRYGGDPNSIHLFGHSAGGQMVAQVMVQRALALTCNHPLPLPRACFRQSPYHHHPIPLWSTGAKATVLDGNYSGGTDGPTIGSPPTSVSSPSSVSSLHGTLPLPTEANREVGGMTSPTEHMDYYLQQQEQERKKRAVSSDVDYRRCPPISSVTLAGAVTDLSYQLAFEHAWGGDRISTLEPACRGYYTLNSPTLLLNALPATPTTRTSSPDPPTGGASGSPAGTTATSCVSSCHTTPRTKELARMHVPADIIGAGFSPLNPLHLPLQICLAHGVHDKLVDLNQSLMLRDALRRQIGPQQTEARVSLKQMDIDHIGLVLGPITADSSNGKMHPVVAALAATMHKAQQQQLQ